MTLLQELRAEKARLEAADFVRHESEAQGSRLDYGCGCVYLPGPDRWHVVCPEGKAAQEDRTVRRLVWTGAPGGYRPEGAFSDHLQAAGVVIRLVVPFNLQRCSPNRRLHHMAKARETRAAREAARCAWVAAGSPRLEGKVRVSVIVRRARPLDQANIWAACKGALDGIFVEGVTPDDGPEFVELGRVQQEVGKAWKGAEQVVFVIERAAP